MARLPRIRSRSLAVLPALLCIAHATLAAEPQPTVERTYAAVSHADWPSPTAEQRARARGALDAFDAAEDPVAVETAVRRLAAAGSAAVPEIAVRVRRGSWFERARLTAALAEMDESGVTPLLVAAAHDPSFAVREAAVVGLGKTGDERGRDALLASLDPEREPAWRVRIAAATAIRRGVLRGTIPHTDAEPVLVAALGDPDQDVRRATLAEIAPLRLDGAREPVLEIFTDPGLSPDERGLALDVLRSYRRADDALLDALRAGFVEWDDDFREQAARAGHALLRFRGPSVLEDEPVADAVRTHLLGAQAQILRDAIAAWDAEAGTWLAAEARDQAHRHAAGRSRHEHDLLEAVVELLVHVDRAAAVELLREFLVGPDAEVLAYETRRFVVRKVRAAFAVELRDAVRSAYSANRDAALAPDLLSAVVAAGGDDLEPIVTAALASEVSRLRRRALELAERLPSLDLTAALLALASGDLPVTQRASALSALAHRAPGAARELARSALDTTDGDLRSAAVRVLAAAGEPDDARLLEDLLREQLVPTRTADDGTDEPDAHTGPTTASESSRQEQLRRRLRGELFGALVELRPDGGRVLALELLASDAPDDLRVKAAQTLVEAALPHDADQLLALLETGPGERVARALTEALSRQADHEPTRRHFTEGVQSSGSRRTTLALLVLPSSRVVPDGLADALLDDSWDEVDREAALAILLRAGELPPADRLVELIRTAVTPSLAREAIHALARHPDDVSGPRLVALLDDLEPDGPLGFVVEELGRTGRTAVVPRLVEILQLSIGHGLDAARGTDPWVRLAEQSAVALGRIGSDAAGQALATRLLEPGLVDRVSRHAAEVQGPFHPDAAPAVRIVRALVRGLARFEPEPCERLCDAALATVDATGAGDGIPESFLDGVARYLHDPMAYRLPNRRRTRAALLFRRRVTRVAPRLTELDRQAWASVSSELSQQQRPEDALDAYRRSLAIADVEDAGRPDETREWERGKLRVLEARALAATGASEQALTHVLTLRDAAPSSEQLAYLQAYGLVKLGTADERARDAVRFSVARADWRPHAHFYLGWITEQLDGPAEALPHYREAVQRDLRRVRTSTAAETVRTRAGLSHPWADFCYFHARAAARLDEPDIALVRQQLVRAIELDDRYAAIARRDAVFQTYDGLDEVIDAALASIPD